MADMAGVVVLLREVQHFRQLWLWLMIVIVPIACLISILDVIVFDKCSDPASASIIATLIIGIILGIGIPWLMYVTNLTTEVRTDGIYIRYFPFHRSFRKVSQEITRCEIRKYNPIKEYGGWGIRGFKSDRAYNVSGDMGIQLTYSDGNKLLIGTHRPDELLSAIRSIHK